MSRTVIVIIVISIIALLIIVVIWIAFSRYSVPKPNSNPSTKVVGLYYSCRGGNRCGSGLICDVATQTCRLPDGSQCMSYADCQTGSFCSGICVRGSYGGLGQYCPCNSRILTCVRDPGGDICKRVSWAVCSTDSDCASSLCLGGICQPSLPLGSVCSLSSQCGGNICDEFKFCQLPGLVSGQEDAFCISGQPPPSSGSSSGPGCSLGLFCQNSRCVPATSGIGNPCGDMSTCAPPFVCTDSDTLLSCTDSDSCVCILPPDSNTCPLGVCSSGYTCRGTSRLCVGQVGQPCTVNADCAGQCSSTPVIMVLNVPPGQVISSTNVSWTKHSNAPERFSKIFGEGDIDSPLMGKGASGLWQYIGSRWILILPQVTNSGGRIRNFENAASKRQENGTVLYYTAFDEIGGGMADRTLYSMTISPTGGTPTLTPFNVSGQSGHIDGTQYTTDGAPIIFSDLSISTSNDILLWNGTSTYYVKPSLNPRYNVLTLPNDGRMPSFYYDTSRTIPYISTDNVSYVGNLPSDRSSFVVQFIGTAVDVIYPRNPDGALKSSYLTTSYSIYSPIEDDGMTNATGGIISRNLSTGRSSIYLITGGQQLILPGFSNEDTLINAAPQSLYIYSEMSCI